MLTQLALFESPAQQVNAYVKPICLPAGLQYYSQYISSQVARDLITAVDASPWLDDLKRRVQHYGYRYDYKSRRINYDMYLGALPDWGQQLSLRMYVEGILPFVADQLIINEYLPGQGITPHIDCEPCFEDTIASLSLNSSCLMDFTQAETLETTSLLLDPSSLLVLSGEARYNWKHGIANRKKDKYNNQIIERNRRISLTFRKVIIK